MLAAIKGDAVDRRPGVRPRRRVRRVPAVEPGPPGEDLPRRRRQHADRVSRRCAGDGDSPAAPAGNAGLLVGALLVALPMLDTALVIVSRTRRGVTLVTGGRDHLTHRLLLTLGTPRAVAVVLALDSGRACRRSRSSASSRGRSRWSDPRSSRSSAGVAAILVLDTARWRPAGIAYGPATAGHPRAEPGIR